MAARNMYMLSREMVGELHVVDMHDTTMITDVCVSHLAVLCTSVRCGAHGTFCYGIS